MRTIAAILALTLTACATPGYDQYLIAVQVNAQANAEVKRANAAAISAIAQNGGETAKAMAVMMLALNNGPSTLPVEPPRDQALQWASVLVPSATAIFSGYFGYRLGVTQSNNQASTTQASYGAMNSIANTGFGTVEAFRPIPVDWAGVFSAVQPNVTNTTTITNTAGTNAVMGDGQIGTKTNCATGNTASSGC